ncbi:UNVERIFIED_CONTAM: Retrovirus-related Pol polyprotein from transposon RE2 [Sesamum radiatum]|uniref:Retrovirus-related Pol polyprotein from transposon RE2 n=1 Tax=Sesamum radiatum TaxID=300843 RepID=A0AAW2S2L6_SESRA
MDQTEGFTSIGEEHKVFHLQRSIYGLKQGSQSWNIHFDEVIQGNDLIKNDFDPCVYKKVSGSLVAFLVLYVDDILLIGNDVKMLEIQDGKLQTRIPSEAWVKLSKKQFPKTDEEFRKIFDIPYASAVGSIQYVVQCTRSDLAFALSVTSRYQACAGEAHWTAVNTTLTKKRYILDYDSEELILEGYNDASFQSDEDDTKS